jgi:hypothetical protein
MESLLPVALFLTFMTLLYVVLLSRRGILERRIHAYEKQRMRVRMEYATMSEAEQRNNDGDTKPVVEAVASDQFEITKN